MEHLDGFSESVNHISQFTPGFLREAFQQTAPRIGNDNASSPPRVLSREPKFPSPGATYIQRMPRWMRATDNLEYGVRSMPKVRALQHRYIQPDAAEFTGSITADVDRPGGWYAADDAKILAPNIVTIIRRMVIRISRGCLSGQWRGLGTEHEKRQSSWRRQCSAGLCERSTPTGAMSA